jgi:hypothetical protein
VTRSWSLLVRLLAAVPLVPWLLNDAIVGVARLRPAMRAIGDARSTVVVDAGSEPVSSFAAAVFAVQLLLGAALLAWVAYLLISGTGERRAWGVVLLWSAGLLALSFAPDATVDLTPSGWVRLFGGLVYVAAIAAVLAWGSASSGDAEG